MTPQSLKWLPKFRSNTISAHKMASELLSYTLMAVLKPIRITFKFHRLENTTSGHCGGKTTHWKLWICKIYSRCYLPVRNVDVCGKRNPGNPSLSQKSLPSILLGTIRNATERQNLV